MTHCFPPTPRLVLTALLLLTLTSISCEPEVVPNPRVPTAVAVTPDTATLAAIEATVDLSARVYDQHGNVMPATLEWSRTPDSVVAVGANGRVTATSDGVARVTATAGSASGTATITVRRTVATVRILRDGQSVVQGDTHQMMAVVLDSSGYDIPDADLDWTSSDTTVAVVNDNGLVLGVREGAVLITAYAGDAYDAVEVPVVNRERAALQAIYMALNGDSWTDNTNWLTETPIAEWYGVSVDSAGRVRSVSLPRNRLWGNIPTEITYLDELTNLNLAYNRIDGTMPAEIGKHDESLDSVPSIQQPDGTNPSRDVQPTVAWPEPRR